MTKAAESFTTTRQKSETVLQSSQKFTYSVEIPGFLEGESLFETHYSQSLVNANRQTDVCLSAYLNTPHQGRSFNAANKGSPQECLSYH